MPIRTASARCAPAAAATTERFSRQRWVCSPIDPSTSWPVFGSRWTWPLQNTSPLETTACEYGPAASGAPVAVTVLRWWDMESNLPVSNRLANETSPYLLQHAGNPVDWYPWGEEALARARAEDKPILLSIGYSACHWCHVMEHESFENPEIAGLMNRSFVNVKVDREERPDLDSIYMTAVQAMTGHGGWPLNVFVTPEGVPFYGGTYWPPTDRQ